MGESCPTIPIQVMQRDREAAQQEQRAEVEGWVLDYDESAEDALTFSPARGNVPHQPPSRAEMRKNHVTAQANQLTAQIKVQCKKEEEQPTKPFYPLRVN